MTVARVLPWWLKAGVKLGMSRLPVGYQRWRRLPVFSHGAMDNPVYARRVFESHMSRVERPVSGATILELGPGDSVATALCGHAAGAAATVLVDSGHFAIENLRPYRSLAAVLAADGLPSPDLEGVNDLETMLDLCRAKYLTRGLLDLMTIPPSSVDVVFSHAVLEHVRLDEFDDVQRQLRRVLRPGGIASHRIDLEDHLAHSLHALRFSPSSWERELIRSSGFYTNRIRYVDMCQRFRDAGFDVDVMGVERWPSLPLDRAKLHRTFRILSDDELRISAFDVLLRPALD